ncbi:uncharacterized protein FFB20_05512 [Fusarium fujikuroi]|nr:uncharacterized protein FFB20_05512 [Fusarium fujikuroi]SCO24836.1 uncharacterized protein FFC1_15218 [Fusarium fujikuroi]
MQPVPDSSTQTTGASTALITSSFPSFTHAQLLLCRQQPFLNNAPHRSTIFKHLQRAQTIRLSVDTPSDYQPFRSGFGHGRGGASRRNLSNFSSTSRRPSGQQQQQQQQQPMAASAAKETNDHQTCRRGSFGRDRTASRDRRNLSKVSTAIGLLSIFERLNHVRNYTFSSSRQPSGQLQQQQQQHQAAVPTAKRPKRKHSEDETDDNIAEALRRWKKRELSPESSKQAETLLDAATKSRDNNLLQSNSAALANKIQELESQLQQAKVQLEESQAEERRVQAQISDLHFMLEYGDWYAFLLKAMRPHQSTIEQDDAVNKIRPLPLSAFHDHTTQARVSGTAQAEAENRQYTGPNDEQKKSSLKSSKTFSQTRKGLQDGTVLMGGKQHRHMR